MARRPSLDFLQKFLPAETFNVLNSPTKDELTSLGQRELPFPEGETDFLPREVVEEERIELARGGLLDEVFGPIGPKAGPMPVAPPATQSTFLNELESSLAPPSQVPFSAMPASGPTWNAPKGSDIVTTPPNLPPPTTPSDRVMGPGLDYPLSKYELEVIGGQQRLFGPAAGTQGYTGGLAEPKTVRGEFLEANRELLPEIGAESPMGQLSLPGLQPPALANGLRSSPDLVDRLSPTEFEAVYGARDIAPMPEGPPSPWMKPRGTAGRPASSVLADPSLEAAVHYGQDISALPAGRYEEYPLEGGRGARFVPQDPANQARFNPPPEEPGVALPTLSGLKRQLEDLTGEGVAQPLMPTKVARTPEVEEAISEIDRLGIVSRDQMETVWDRVSGAEGENAEAKFLDVVNGIFDYYNEGGPQRAQAYFTEARKFIPGIDGEGFGERVRVEDAGFNRAQLDEWGDTGMPQGFRGSETDADARQDFNPRKRALDKKEDFLIGQRPLAAMAKRPGLGDDPVENFLRGSADLGVVPKGSLAPGANRVQSTGAPSEVEVVKVTPLRGNPGYLKAVSRRSGIPLRNLQLMIDSGQEFDLVQVRRPSGKAPELPPEGRWRAPEDLQFWNSPKGESQKEKLLSDPPAVEKLLQSPGARVVRADQGVGKEVLAVVRREGKPFAVVEAGGKKVLRPLQRNDKGQLTYNGKAIPANMLEKDPTRGALPDTATGLSDRLLPERAEPLPSVDLQKESRRTGIPKGESPLWYLSQENRSGPHVVRPPKPVTDKPDANDLGLGFISRGFDPELRSSKGEKISPERLSEEVYAGKGPVAVKGLQLAGKPIRTDFSKVGFALAGSPRNAKGGSASLPPLAKDPSKAELTLTFTAREKPSPANPEGFPTREAGERELVNPSVEDIVEVLSRSNISKVAVRVEEGSRKGPAEGAWERAKAILKRVKDPKVKALVIGAGALGLVAGSEEEAEAASPRSAMESFSRTKAAREALPPPQPGDESFLQGAYTKLIDQFEPVYRAARDLLGPEGEDSLRKVLQTEYGGGAGKAELELEPVRLALQDMRASGLEEEYNQYLTWNQGLRQWDVLARKRDNYLSSATAARTAGRERDAKEFEALAKSIDDKIASGEVVEQGLRKEDLSAFLEDLRARVGDEHFRKIEAAASAPYRVVQEKLDEMHAEGLVDDWSYNEYKARGEDHIPAWKTPFEVDAEGNTTYKGGSVSEAPLGTSLQVREEGLIKEVFGSQGVTKDPLENTASFVTRGEQEINRNRIAKAVAETFSGSGVAKRHRVRPKESTLAPGNKLYTFMEGGKTVHYELPAYLVDSLALLDKNFSRKLLQHLPGNKLAGAARAVAEAGVTTANVGFGAYQSAIADPVTALIQVDWRDGALREIAPYAKVWFKELLKGFARENQTLMGVQLPGVGHFRESSPLRKRAAKAKALYSGATSQVLDPRDTLGNKGFSRAKDAFRQKDLAEAGREATSAFLHPFTSRIMKPFEEANKLATFARQEAGGADPTTAAYETRKFGGSPDWAQSGSRDETLRYLVSFGRPALLGVEAALRAAKRNPKRLSAVMGGSLALETLRQLSNQAAAEAAGMSLEEAEGRFSEYDKDNTFLVMLPETETLSNGTTRPKAVKVPIPPILRLYMSPFKGAAKSLRSGNPLDVPLAMADESLPGTVPLKSDDLLGTLGRRVGASLPAPFRIGAEQAMDKQFFTGAPIVGSRLEGLPAEEQFSESTQPFFKTLGKATGLSPVRAQHIVKGMLPGAFETPIQLLNALEPKTVPEVAKGEMEGLADLPFLGPALLRRFIPQKYESELGDLQGDFYGLADQTRSAATSNRRAAEGIGSLPSALTQRLGTANPDVTAVMRNLSALSKAQKQIIAAPNLDPEAKRDQMKALQDQRRELLRGFLSDPTIQLLLKGEIPE